MPMNLFLKKIINSGQDGAEQGALAACFLSECPTGGNIPKGYKTESGNKPSLKVFELEETENDSCPDAISKNVQISGGTLIYTKTQNDTSDVEEYIKEQCNQHDKPFLVIPKTRYVRPEELVSFIKKHKINVLHVSGKTDKGDKIMFDYVREHFERFIVLVKKDARRDETSKTFVTSGVEVNG